MTTEKIEKISKIEKAVKADVPGVDEIQDAERMASNKERFDNLMTAEQPAKLATISQIEPVAKTSLMDEVRSLNQRVDHFSKISPKELAAQTNDVIAQIDSIKKKLSTPSLELKPSAQTILQNKLSHIDENLRVALSKTGLEYSSAESFENKRVNPIERFLGFLSNGQAQLASLSHELELMHLNNKELSPANMLRIQVKVGYITQEIEFFTAVLNKSLDSTKTIMNIQI